MKIDYASLSIVLDKNGRIKKDLYQTNTLKELDEFMQNYHNSEEVRDCFQNQINSFLEENKWYIDNVENIALQEGRKPRFNRGRIVVYYKEAGKMHIVPILYKGEQLRKKIGLRTILESLNNEKNFKKLIEEKRYLIGYSDYLKEAITIYKKYHSKQCMQIIISELIENLRTMDKEDRYYYLRSLTNLCNLKETVIKTKHGVIKNLNIPLEKTVLLRERIVDDCCDEYFMKLIDDENYEELFNNYDVSEILKYSKDINNPLGIRRK